MRYFPNGRPHTNVYNFSYTFLFSQTYQESFINFIHFFDTVRKVSKLKVGRMLEKEATISSEALGLMKKICKGDSNTF